jgi:hypothetical protein
VRGSLVPKINYTETLGPFLIPFVAAVVSAAPGRSARTLALGVALLGSMAFLLVLDGAGGHAAHIADHPLRRLHELLPLNWWPPAPAAANRSPASADHAPA